MLFPGEEIARVKVDGIISGKLGFLDTGANINTCIHWELPHI